MSSPYVAAANAPPVPEPKPAKKNKANRKGRATKMAAADDILVSDTAAMQSPSLPDTAPAGCQVAQEKDHHDRRLHLILFNGSRPGDAVGD